MLSTSPDGDAMTLVNAVAGSGHSASLVPAVVLGAAGDGSTGGKDSRWLTLEVCREFARSKCSRSDDECKYAHPPPHVDVQNGRVMCCFDSIKVYLLIRQLPPTTSQLDKTTVLKTEPIYVTGFRVRNLGLGFTVRDGVYIGAVLIL